MSTCQHVGHPPSQLGRRNSGPGPSVSAGGEMEGMGCPQISSWAMFTSPRQREVQLKRNSSNSGSSVVQFLTSRDLNAAVCIYSVSCCQASSVEAQVFKISLPVQFNQMQMVCCCMFLINFTSSDSESFFSFERKIQSHSPDLVYVASSGSDFRAEFLVKAYSSTYRVWAVAWYYCECHGFYFLENSMVSFVTIMI